MFVLLTYDIDQSDGGKRLRKVAKICEGYGIRVQNSVFELSINNAELLELQGSLKQVVDDNLDSVRIYKIGKENNVKIVIIGAKEKIEITESNGFIL